MELINIVLEKPFSSSILLFWVSIFLFGFFQFVLSIFREKQKLVANQLKDKKIFLEQIEKNFELNKKDSAFSKRSEERR